MPTSTSITAKDLVDWAKHYQARFTLPQLIRRLFLASATDLTKLQLPSDEEVCRPGYDGIVEAGKGKGNPWVPEKSSVWEMGVDINPAAKAEKDYKKRNKKPGVRRSSATFLFVSSPTEKNRAELARKLLDSWRTLPGSEADGSIDDNALRNWTQGVRQSAKEQKCEEGSDIQIGELFSSAPPERDGVWPCIAVRKLIEELRSDDIESSMGSGHFNRYQPGSETPPIPETSWREFADRHRKHADVVAGRWPRTGAMLRKLAALYEGSARRRNRIGAFED